MYTFSNGHLIPFKNNLIWGKTKEHAEQLAKHVVTDIKIYNLSIKHADISISALPALQYLVNLEHLTLEISGDAHLECKALAESNPSMKKMHTLELFAKHKDIPEYVNKYISYFNNLKHLTIEGRSITQLENLATIIYSSISQLETLNLSARDTDISKYFIHSIEKLASLKHLTLEGRKIENIENLTISLHSLSKLESFCLSAKDSGTSSVAVQEKSMQNAEITVQSGISEHKLKKLKLAIRDTYIPGSAVEYIRNNVNLEQLILKGKQIQNVECLANFLLDMTQLETLKLTSRDADIPGSVVKAIGKLNNIKHLTLKGGQIKDDEMLAISRMTQLETLKLSLRDTDIPGSVLYCIQRFYNLKDLTLEGRQIQNIGSLVSILPLLRQLEKLKLSSRDTHIPGYVITCIEKYTHLKILKCEGRSFECAKVLD